MKSILYTMTSTFLLVSLLSSCGPEATQTPPNISKTQAIQDRMHYQLGIIKVKDYKNNYDNHFLALCRAGFSPTKPLKDCVLPFLNANGTPAILVNRPPDHLESIAEWKGKLKRFVLSSSIAAPAGYVILIMGAPMSFIAGTIVLVGAAGCFILRQVDQKVWGYYDREVGRNFDAIFSDDFESSAEVESTIELLDSVATLMNWKVDHTAVQAFQNK